MWGYTAFAAVLVLVVLGPQAADPPKPVAPVRPEDLKDNVHARLVGSEVSEGRAQTVIFKFETLGEDRKEILFAFSPRGDTTHIRTLGAIFSGCQERDNKTGRYKVKDGVEAIFSLPKDGIPGYGTPDAVYEQCYLVSLKIGQKK